MCVGRLRQLLPEIVRVTVDVRSCGFGDSPLRIFPRIVRSASKSIAWPYGMLGADTEGEMCRGEPDATFMHPIRRRLYYVSENPKL